MINTNEIDELSPAQLDSLIAYANRRKQTLELPDATVEENTDHRFGKVYGITAPNGESLCDEDLAYAWGFKDWETMFNIAFVGKVKTQDDLATFQYVGQAGRVCTDTFFYNKEDAEKCLAELKANYKD